MDAEVVELHNLSRDPVCFAHFIRISFEWGRNRPGFKAIRSFILEVGRGSIWDSETVTCFALDVMGFIFNLPAIEEVNLRGVPLLELRSILEFLSSGTKSGLPCPNSND